MVQTNVSPDRDASLGLIFRLNNLWSKVDYYSTGGMHDKWNDTLDALYRNLHFRDRMVIIKDEETGKIIKIKPSEEDIKEFRHFSIEISEVKRNFRKARTYLDKRKARNKLYHLIQNKDMWLRKHMQKLKLYMKETERRPGSSTFGTFGSKNK